MEIKSSAMFQTEVPMPDAKILILYSKMGPLWLFVSSLPVAGVPQDLEDGVSDVSYANFNDEKAKAGTAEFLIQLENKRSIKVTSSAAFCLWSVSFMITSFYDQKNILYIHMYSCFYPSIYSDAILLSSGTRSIIAYLRLWATSSSYLFLVSKLTTFGAWILF